MIETLSGPLSDYGATALVLTIAAMAAGLVHAYVAHRTRLHQERKTSTRAAVRLAGLVELAAEREVVRILERDRDGHREVKLGGRVMPGHDAREAA
jgi:predicted aspartyl protease